MFQSKHYLREIIDKEPLLGSFLYERGIVFTNYADRTIHDVCELHRIKVNKLLAEIESWDNSSEKPSLDELRPLPVDLLIGFLQSAHQRFLWRRLPYMKNLVDGLDPEIFDVKNIIRDLKLIFPIFADDFIHHIHEEEDKLFNRVLEMNKVVKRGSNPGRIFLTGNGDCLHEMALMHHEDDDDMEGIRNLTDNYQLPENAGLNLKVIYAELEHFEKELRHHAAIENEILFPKAISLQKQLDRKIKSAVAHN